MREILNAIESRGDRAVFEALSVPATYRAALIRKEDVEMFAGMASKEKIRASASKSIKCPSPNLHPVKHSSR